MNPAIVFQNSFKGKKVFLTGHTGFKGSWMLAWLHQLGADIKGYSLAPENDNDLFNLINGSKLCNSVIADIRDKEKLTKEILSFKPDYIFHLAAQPLVRRSYEQPLYTFEVNITGTANLLDALRQLKNNCAVVVITTDKVYENIEQHYAYKEEDKLGGHDPYSASKAAAEIVVNSYRDSYFNNSKDPVIGLASARAGNVIGGGDRAKDRIIPDIVRGLESSQSILVRNPSSIRPWQHVLEPLGAYLLIAHLLKQNSAFAQAWNIGPETQDVLTVKQVVENAIDVYGKGEYHTPEPGDQPHEANLLQLDITKAKEQLSWKPLLNSLQAIEWTMNWYKEAMNGTGAAELTNNQIKEYSQL